MIPSTFVGSVVPTATASSVGTVVPTPTPAAAAASAIPIEEAEYRTGLATVAFITLLFASNSPALRSAFTSVSVVPPVLLVNAIAGSTAITSLLLGGPLLASMTAPPSTLAPDASDSLDEVSLRAGLELGTWKTLGTAANLLGLSLTSAGHGAFLVQLTTLIVPLVQGSQGVAIPKRIWGAVGLALVGLCIFTLDPSGADGGASLPGDAACVLAALCYAAYDLRLFVWGRRVAPLTLITTKVAAQACLSLAALALFGRAEATAFLAAASPEDLATLAPLLLWSGVVVNGVAPFLQVGGQQAIGPARAQVVYASGPLWAALLSLVFLGETVGPQGALGGGAFLSAVFLAASADPEGAVVPEGGEEEGAPDR